MAFLQQLHQPASLVGAHFPRPEHRRLSVARDLSDNTSPSTVALDCKYVNCFPAIRIIGGSQPRGFAHPSFSGEHIAVHAAATKAIPQRRTCRTFCTTIRPIRRNVKTFTVGHTLKSSKDLSGALELGADATQHVIQVLVERELSQLFPRVCCRLPALVTVRHDLMTPHWRSAMGLLRLWSPLASGG